LIAPVKHQFHMRDLLDSTDALNDGAELLRRMNRDGYLLIRELLPAKLLGEVRRQMLEIADQAGWLKPGTPLEEGVANMDAFCVEPQPEYRNVYNRMYHLEAFHALPHHPNIMGLFERMLGAPILLHPRIIGRVIFPRRLHREDFTTPAHQDYPHIQGTTATYAAWFPLSDCSIRNGGLIVAQGSHTQGVRDFRLAFGAGGLEVTDELTDSWVGGDMKAGDVLIHNNLTVHKGLPNLTDRLRVSMDCRYQRADEPVNIECIEQDGNPHTWEEIYSGWRSTEQQYYWRQWPLKTVPFDRTFHERRDALAFEAAAKGDTRSISTLQRIVTFDPNPSKRVRAQELLEALSHAV
jgi:ectoine hydroxylase-related dioxygenase (phytanoyl-CoA dioxygenase family)